MELFTKTIDLITKGMEDSIFPGAVFATGDKNGEIKRAHCGFSALYPQKEVMTGDTLFDVASLSKIISTTMIAIKLIESGKLNLSDKIGLFFDVPSDKRNINIWNLMTHTSGLPDTVRLDKMGITPDEACRAILEQKLSYAPGIDVTYSCLGYILLGKICEKIENSDLSRLAKRMVFEPLGLHNAAYNPDLSRYNIAKTEFDPDSQTYLHGKVHDENARFLNGISGNAGVFADISDCSAYALMLANRGKVGNTEFINRDLFEESIKNHTSALSEGRGLGFAVKDGRPSSAGSVFANGSYGHTGYTGTSIWINIETTQYIVLLTNRVHPTRENTRLINFRKTIHDSGAEEYKSLH